MDRIDKILLEFGIPAQLYGFRYIRDALEITESDPQAIKHITNVLYPKIAEKNNTTWKRVERDILHTIDRTWGSGYSENLECIFGNSVPMGKARPSNKQFIATLAMCLNREEEENP